MYHVGSNYKTINLNSTFGTKASLLAHDNVLRNNNLEQADQGGGFIVDFRNGVFQHREMSTNPNWGEKKSCKEHLQKCGKMIIEN